MFWLFLSLQNHIGPIDYHCMDKKNYEIYNDNLFCDLQKKEVMQVWNNMRVSVWWQNGHFWMDYAFNKLNKVISVFHIYF